jgi:putative transcriptional regulator
VIEMIKTNIQNLLNKKGKTRYWLVKEMQTTYKTVNKICDNTLTGLQLETIEKLCDILECSPNDLFIIE